MSNFEPIYTLRRAEDYEVRLGRGKLQIKVGHPNYCWNPYPHLAHEFGYIYLNGADEEVNGSYYCGGDGAFARHLLVADGLGK